MARKVIAGLVFTAASAGAVVASARAFGPLKDYALGGVRTEEVLSHGAVRLYRKLEEKRMSPADRVYRRYLDGLSKEKRAAVIAARNADRKGTGLPDFKY